MPQTAVASALTVGYAGMIASHKQSDVLESYALKNATSVPLGCAVVHDATNGDGTCKLPAGATDAIVGVAYDDGSLTSEDSGAYAQYEDVPVVRKGFVFVVTEEAVDPTKGVWVRHTANGAGKTVGQFRQDTDGGKAVQLKNCQWRQTTSALGYALLEVNLPSA